MSDRAYITAEDEAAVAAAVAAGRVTGCPPAYVGVVTGAKPLEEPVPSYDRAYSVADSVRGLFARRSRPSAAMAERKRLARME